MKKTLYTLGYFLAFAVAFSSCEMKDELTGKNIKTSYGEVNINIENPSAPDSNSRVDAGNSGEIIGQFPEEDVNVNNYILKITDSTGGEVEGGGKISEIGKDGKVSVSLLEGEYTFSAYNYDGSNVNVSEKPYFLGTNKLTVESGVDTGVDMVCKLNNIQILLNVDEQFTAKFNDDYEFTVDNGDGAIQVITKDNVGKKYYFKVPANKNYITVTSKATVKSEAGVENAGQTIIKTFKVTKPADADGNSNLASADAFTINIKDEENTSSYIGLGMTVDFSFTDKEEIITIPVEDIVDGTVPGPKPEPDNSISFEGLPAEYTDPADSSTPVVVTINAESGIQNLFVTISSNNEGFTGSLAGFGLDKQFDIANPGELEGVLCGSLEEGTGIGLIKPGEKIRGEKKYVFDVTEFMSLLKLFGPSVNTFSIKVVDAESNEKSGDLKVTITKGL